jgi:hypothetical protein
MLGRGRGVAAVPALDPAPSTGSSFLGEDMTRTLRLLRRTSPMKPTKLPTFPCPPGAARLALLLFGLLAAGCGALDNQRVPEDFPSGARPAPVPKVDLAAAGADKVELPPPPPAEPGVEPAPPEKLAAVATRPGSEAAPGHLRLSGTYQADAGAVVTCTLLAGRGLRINLDSAAAPVVEVTVADFLGAGHYVAAVRLLTRGTAQAERPPAGEAQLDIQIAELDRPHVRSLLSGTFNGGYAGQGVQGQLAGTFDRCLYGGALP